MQTFKNLRVFIMVLVIGILVAIPISVVAGTHHQIYDIAEVHNPSPYNTTLHVRTSLGVEYVWVYTNGRTIQGVQISHGSVMQVWQVSFISPRAGQPVTVKVNCSQMSGGSYFSLSFQPGRGPVAVVPQETQSHSVAQQQPVVVQPVLEETSHHINTIVTVSNAPGGQVRAYTSTATWRGISISGDESFVRRTLRALEEIEAGPEWAYVYVTTYLSYIVQDTPTPNTRSGGRVNVRTRRFYVYTNTYTSRWRGWYASVIIHEAVHVRQYREHRESSTRSSFTGSNADRIRREIEAVEFQIKFLDEMGITDTANMARRIIRDIHNGIFWW